jgi:uncharacterized protein YdaU (DUF1376 family)
MSGVGHNGGPAYDIDTDEVKMSWIKLDIADFKRGIADLDYETRGFYITILVEMYDSKGKLPNDTYLLGKRLGTTARVIKRVLEVLIDQGKVYVSGDTIRNRRCDEEREKVIAEYCRRHAAALKREADKRRVADANGEVSGKFDGSFSEVSAKPSRNPTKFDESLGQTFPNSPTKSREPTPQLDQNSDHNCAYNLEVRSKKVEVSEERKSLQPASVVPASPEGLASLNGSADMMIADVRKWMNGAPEQNARNWLSTHITIYGPDVVKDSYAKLGTDLASGKLIAQPIQTWGKIAQRMRDERKNKPASSEAMRQLNALVTRR